MKLGLLLSGAVRALDIQSQFRAYIDTAYPSCQAVIAKCERPFIGYDVKERVLDVQNLNLHPEKIFANDLLIIF